MTQIGTTLSSVLIGALANGAASDAARDALLAAGRAPEDVLVLTGEAGLDELRSRQQGFLPAITRLIRQIEALQSDGTGHVLEAAESSLRDGHDVVVVRHVDAPAAASLAGLLRANGVSHVHYIGRWTVSESGVVPSPTPEPTNDGLVCEAPRR